VDPRVSSSSVCLCCTETVSGYSFCSRNSSGEHRSREHNSSARTHARTRQAHAQHAHTHTYTHTHVHRVPCDCSPAVHSILPWLLQQTQQQQPLLQSTTVTSEHAASAHGVTDEGQWESGREELVVPCRSCPPLMLSCCLSLCLSVSLPPSLSLPLFVCVAPCRFSLGAMAVRSSGSASAASRPTHCCRTPGQLHRARLQVAVVSASLPPARAARLLGRRSDATQHDAALAIHTLCCIPRAHVW
jgi:hypothetical protein